MTRVLARAALAAALAAACSSEPEGKTAVVDVEGLGEIRFELLRDLAPKTTAHFIELARAGFYDGTIFHRVIPGFVVQGGEPSLRRGEKGGPADPVEDEFNATHHARGVVSMANSGYPGSARSQFFFVVQDAPHLDGKYTAFGRVTSGMEVVDRIAAVERDPRQRPVSDVVMRVRVE